MRLLALEGDRNAALTQYARYCQHLRAELDVVPSDAVTELYERIKADRSPGASNRSHPSPSTDQPVEISLPPFLTEAPPGPRSAPICLAREHELGILDAQLDRAVAAQGSLVFVTGEAGRGKTVLLREFVERAQQKHDRLVAVGGQCSSHEGLGDAPAPVPRNPGSAHRRLRAAVGGRHDRPGAGPAVVVHLSRGDAGVAFAWPGPGEYPYSGPGLGRPHCAPSGSGDWCRQLESLARAGSRISSQSPLFDQFTRVLQVLARRRPLLLWLDDLHWVDRASAALLFHLGQRLAGYPLLIVGTYRPEEVSGRQRRRPASARECAA